MEEDTIILSNQLDVIMNDTSTDQNLINQLETNSSQKEKDKIQEPLSFREAVSKSSQ